MGEAHGSLRGKEGKSLSFLRRKQLKGEASNN
jgi:hypothetical protein